MGPIASPPVSYSPKKAGRSGAFRERTSRPTPGRTKCRRSSDKFLLSPFRGPPGGAGHLVSGSRSRRRSCRSAFLHRGENASPRKLLTLLPPFPPGQPAPSRPTFTIAPLGREVPLRHDHPAGSGRSPCFRKSVGHVLAGWEERRLQVSAIVLPLTVMAVSLLADRAAVETMC